MNITAKKTFQEAEKHYAQLRQLAFVDAQREFQATLNLPITVTSISLEAIAQSTMWAAYSQAFIFQIGIGKKKLKNLDGGQDV